MRQSDGKRLATIAAVLSTTVGGVSIAPAALAAETRVTDDYAAVIIEGEDYVTLDERWIPTDASTAPTPETEPDPDGNHSDGASGGAYLELLPDYRQSHTVTVPEGTPLSRSLWGKPGTGPQATYAVDFPEPGRYYVHVRAYTTGTEDNGLHIGLDGEWPSSGAALQICTAAAKAWRWSNKKRDSGGQPCGIRHTIWLTVEEAGPAEVMISAREDGFELDRMMLIKDRSDNTRNCAPVFNQADNITCQDGGIETVDELVDLDLVLESSAEEGIVGDTIELEAEVRNLDGFDHAEAVRLTVDLDEDEWRVVESDERCETESGDVVCALGDLGPSGDEEGERVALALEALTGGVLRIDATASADQVDDEPENDSVRLDVEIDDPLVPTTLIATLGGLPGVVEIGAPSTLAFSLANAGGAKARDARIVLELPEGLAIDVPPTGCEVEGSRIDCGVGALGIGESRTFSVTVWAQSEGDYAIATAASAANAIDSGAAASLAVIAPETGNGGDDVGDDGGETGETDGGSGTDDGGTSAGETGGADAGSAERRTTEDGGAAGPLTVLALVLLGLVRRRAPARVARG